MMNLQEIANKISKIFNGTDSETASTTRPIDYQFLVAAQGFHLDSIADMKTGNNMIPVFVSSLGGSIQPIPNLLKSSYSISVTIYFPLRFKNDFFSFSEFIASVFVGKTYDYGTNTGKCVSNISVPQYGEIEELDLDEFYNWVNHCYKMKISTMGMWMSMTFELYLSTAADNGKPSGPIYGNEVKVSLSFSHNGTTYKDNEPYFADTSITANGEPNAEQVLGQKETAGLLVNTSYAVPMNLVVKETPFYLELLKIYVDGEIQNLPVNLVLEIERLNIRYERTCFMSNVGLSLPKGELIMLTFNLSKKVEI